MVFNLQKMDLVSWETKQKFLKGERRGRGWGGWWGGSRGSALGQSHPDALSQPQQVQGSEATAPADGRTQTWGRSGMRNYTALSWWGGRFTGDQDKLLPQHPLLDTPRMSFWGLLPSFSFPQCTPQLELELLAIAITEKKLRAGAIVHATLGLNWRASQGPGGWLPPGGAVHWRPDPPHCHPCEVRRQAGLWSLGEQYQQHQHALPDTDSQVHPRTPSCVPSPGCAMLLPWPTSAPKCLNNPLLLISQRLLFT